MATATTDPAAAARPPLGSHDRKPPRTPRGGLLRWRAYTSPMDGCYICPHCGEEIVVPVDLSAGEEQDYVEDCPVCCSPNLLHLTLRDEYGDGEAHVEVWAEPETE